jgi:hypothetical protein
VLHGTVKGVFRGRVPDAHGILASGDDVAEVAFAHAERQQRPAADVVFTADGAIACTLRRSPAEVSKAAKRLWGRSAHEERDRRVAELGELTARQRQAHRGHVTRALTKEIKAHLTMPGPVKRVQRKSLPRRGGPR